MDNKSYVSDERLTNNGTYGDKKSYGTTHDGSQSESKGHGDTVERDKAPLLCSSRLALSIISCLGFINVYALRVNMSVAMVCMINQTALTQLKDIQGRDINNVSKTPLRPSTCHGESITDNASSTDVLDSEDGEFAWPKEIQGLILGSFFWGYLTTQVLGGWLSQRFGGKHVFGWFMFVCAVVTLLMPVTARLHYVALIVTRIIAGVCQGVVWPAMAVLWARWAPPLERGMLCSLCYAGAQIGNVLTFPIAATLCENGFDGGWPSVFYVLGALGVVWFVAWMYLVYDSPELHPRTSDREKKYITQSLQGSMSTSMEKKDQTPWLKILLSMKVWAIVVTHTCANWGTYTFLTNMPTYLREVLYFPVQANGAISALPYIGFFLVINISGVAFDAVMSKQLVSRTVARKIGNTLGLLVPGIFVLAVGFFDCGSAGWAVSLLVIGVSMSGFQYGPGFLTNPADIAPQYAGIIFGLSNTFATLPGFIAPTVIGYITTDQTQSQWQTVFYIASAIYAFGALFFVVFASGEIQDWAVERTEMDVAIKSNEQQALADVNKAKDGRVEESDVESRL